MSLKYLSRFGVLTILTVGIVACSSSGNNSFSNPSTILPPSSEQTEAEKAEAERLENIETNRLELFASAKAAGLSDQQAAAYAETNKEANETEAQSALSTLVAEKIVAEKVEADRIAAAAKAAADKAAAEKAAAEKAAADRIAAEKAEADRIAAEKAAVAKAAAEKAAAEKAAADRIAAEKAEADRIAAERAAAAKAAAEKAEADRIAAERAAAAKAAAEKAEADRIAAEKAEADRIAAEQAAAAKAAADKAAAEKVEADRIAAEKAETERLQKIEVNRVALLNTAKTAGLNNQQAAAYAEANKEASETDAQSALNVLVAEKIAADKTEADRIAAEKAEVERLQKIEDNRVTLLAAAKAAGLTDQQAAAYAEANKQASEADAQSALNTIIAANEKEALRVEVAQAKDISDNTFPVGAITANTRASSSSSRNAFTQESRIQTVVYNQPYSVVLGNYSGNLSYNNQTGAIFTDERDSNIAIRGLKTTPDAIPMLGNATYNGKAFNGTYNTSSSGGGLIEGRLSYDVNFSNRTGSGSITGLGDTVNLQQGSISGTGINSTAQQGSRDGSYLLDFYGKKAEEIAGKVVFDGKDIIGFGGTRGEISK